MNFLLCSFLSYWSHIFFINAGRKSLVGETQRRLETSLLVILYCSLTSRLVKKTLSNLNTLNSLKFKRKYNLYWKIYGYLRRPFQPKH
jgi:hypothetical protein